MTSSSCCGYLDAPLWLADQAVDYGTTALGIEQYAKIPQLVVECMKYANPKISAEAATVGGLGKSIGQTASLFQGPARAVGLIKNVQTFLIQPDGEKLYQIAAGGARFLPSFCDGVELLNSSRIIQLPAATMTLFSRIYSAATVFFAFDWICRDVVELSKAISAYRKEDTAISWKDDNDGSIYHPSDEGYAIQQEFALKKIGLVLIDLCKAISYVAMAAIALLSAFYVVPNAALWILAASTSALFFTLISEFASRSFVQYAPTILGELYVQGKGELEKQLKSGVPAVSLNVPYTDVNGWSLESK
ncbi:MAG: hypothetical protein HYX48_08165 [Chlamydiales bacterium]|nr:hypothetical protein [Chlamydiales bacterium]